MYALRELCAHRCHGGERRGVHAKRWLGVQAAFCWGPTSAEQRAGFGVQGNCWKGPRAPIMGKQGGGCQELAQVQLPSSRGGGGGVAVAHSLQTNHPSFIANSSP